MAKKTQAVVPFTGGVGETAVPSLRDLRHSALISGGFLTERRKYPSTEERKVARKERAKGRRAERRTFLESKGLAAPKRPKLTKAQKKEKSKGLRRLRNIYLREHPEEARKLGMDITRLRV